ncbi:hypothetical protein K438DRAFT_1847577, partial [Mycena galopus ATCC 62051]
TAGSADILPCKDALRHSIEPPVLRFPPASRSHGDVPPPQVVRRAAWDSPCRRNAQR